MDLEWRLRIRNADNTADALVVSSVRDGVNPYVTGAPKGDGGSVDPQTGDSMLGSYVGRIADAAIGGMQRLITAQLEDGQGRQQLSYRHASWEYRENGGAWNTLVNGLLTALRLDSDIEWEVAVGDPMHAHLVTQLFSPASDTLITDFLAQWPLRGCLLGGPVIGSSLIRITDLGGWTMRVEALAGGQYGLQPVTVYGPPRWASDKTRVVDVQDAINDAAANFQIPLSNGAQSPWDTIENAQGNAWAWRGLTVLIDGVPWKPLTVYDEDLGVASSVGRPLLVTGSAKGNFAMKVISDGTRTLVNGSLVRVRALTVLPSDICPMYLVGHPVDLLRQFWDNTGIGYSAAACNALKALLGTDASMTLRITSARMLSDLVATVCLPYGIGLRGNDAGEIEPFDARLGRSPTDPLITIGDADVIQGTVKPFDLDPSKAVKSINFMAKRFVDQRSVPLSRNDATIVDGVVVTNEELQVVDEDSAAVPFGDIDMSFDGMIHSVAALYPTVRDFFIAIGRRVFDRRGRGDIGVRMTLRRGGPGDALKLGDEFLANNAAIPNHNYRLGDNPAIAARSIQIIQRTVIPEGYEVVCEDSGVSGQPPATIPTITIAASVDLPRTVAEVTITNAATLNAAGYGARIQVAYTSDGSDAAASQFTDVAAFAAGKIPTTAIRLPPAIAGRTVQAKACSEVKGARPTNYTALQKVTLTGMDVVTGLTATPGGADGSTCDLAWAIPGSAAGDLVDVWIRFNGQTFAEAAPIATLNPGSVAHQLTGLTPGTNYIASIVLRDPTTQDVGANVDVAFAAGATVVVLLSPIDAAGFSEAPRPALRTPSLLSVLPKLKGTYGIVVVASAIPGQLEVAEAVETGEGTGIYGAFATVGQVPSISGDWTKWEAVAPNDKLRRQLKARHVGDGATASAYSAVVTVTPWTFVPIPIFPGAWIAPPSITPTLASRTRAIEYVSLDGALGANDSGPLQWRYKIGSGAWTALSGAALPVTIAILRADGYDTPVLFEVHQGDGQYAECSFSVPAREINPASTLGEGDRRTGNGGLPVPRGRIPVLPIFDQDGLVPLIDPTTRRFTTDISGPTGITSTVIERGGNKGDGGFTDATGSLISTAKDSRAALLNNHFRYGTDGAGGVVESGTQSFTHPSYLDGSRRPKSLRDQTLGADVDGNDINVGQSRARGGFTDATGSLASTAKDSRAALLNNHFRYGTDGAGGVVESGTQSFTHPSYLDGSRRPKSLRDQTLGADVDGNDINVGQSRARGGFTNATGGLANTSSDSRGALLNLHFRYGTDSSDGIIDGTGSPITGGKRGYQGLDGSYRLQTGVTSLATGVDGYSGIESRRGAARQAGHSAVGLTREGFHRAGLAGLPILDQLFMRIPIYDSTGTQLLFDPYDLGEFNVYRTLTTIKDRVKVKKASSAQSVNNASATFVSFDTTEFDVGAGLADLTNSRILLPTDYQGLWLLHVCVVWDSNATGYRKVEIVEADSITVRSEQTVMAVTGERTIQHVFAVVNDPSTANFRIRVTQNSGGALNVSHLLPQTSFSMFRIW